MTSHFFSCPLCSIAASCCSWLNSTASGTTSHGMRVGSAASAAACGCFWHGPGSYSWGHHGNIRGMTWGYIMRIYWGYQYHNNIGGMMGIRYVMIYRFQSYLIGSQKVGIPPNVLQKLNKFDFGSWGEVTKCENPTGITDIFQHEEVLWIWARWSVAEIGGSQWCMCTSGGQSYPV